MLSTQKDKIVFSYYVSAQKWMECIEWTEVNQNGVDWTRLDRSDPKGPKLTKIDKMDKSGPNWIE